MSEDKEIVKIYSSYTPAQKRATQKYRVNNKDKVNEQRKKYYLSRKEKDPNFLEYKRMKAKEYYQKKKLSKIDEIKSEPIVVSVVEKLPEPEPIIEEIVVVKEVVEKKKRKSPIKKVSIPEPVKVEPEIIKVEEPFTIVSKKRKAKKAI